MRFNKLLTWLINSPLHFIVSKYTMLMTYTGRRSRKFHSLPINYLQIGDDLYTNSSRDRV